jgi:putative ABC transport system permease protein
MKLVNSTLAALRAVRVNKLRSALTMLGIVLGVSSVIVMMAVGAGASQRIQAEMRDLGSNTVILNSGAVKSNGVSRGAGTKPSVTLADVEAIEVEVPSALAVSPQHNSSGMQLIYGSANWSTRIVGSNQDYFLVRNWTMRLGRAFDRDEVMQAAKVVVLGHTVADKLFGSQSPIGQEIRVNHAPMTVIGIMAPKGQNMAGMDQDDTAIIPITTALNRVIGRNPANPRAISGVVIKARDGVPLATIFNEVRQVVRDRHGLLPEQEDDFQLIDMTQVMKAKEESAPRARHPACRHCGGLPPCWRHRHYEHHAGVDHRAHARDRRAHGGWRTAQRHPEPVSGRVDYAISDRRVRRHWGRDLRCARGRLVRQSGRGA